MMRTALLLTLTLFQGAAPALAEDSPGKNEEQRPKLLGALSQSPDRKAAPVRFRDFPRDLGRNFLGLASKENLTPLLIGAGATAAAGFFDDEAQRYFGRAGRLGPSGDVLGEIPGSAGVIGGAIGALALTSHLRGNEKLKSMSYSLAQGFVVTSLVTTGMKLAVGRERPDGSNRRAFPSGHTSNAFAFATIFSHHHPKARIPAYLAASIVAVSRMDEDVHYLSDVVAGATLGYIVGRTVIRQESKKTGPRTTWMPYLSPSRGEAGVLIQVDF